MNNRTNLMGSAALTPSAGIDPRLLENPDYILTEPETARWIRLSPRKLQRDRLEGGPHSIPFVSLGGRRIGYRVGDVQAWIKRRTFTNTSAATVAAQADAA